MPRLPDVTTMRRAVPQNRGGMVDVPVSPVGAALEGVGDTVARIGGQMQEREDQFDYAQAKTQFIVGKAQIEQEFKTDQDWLTFGDRYRERIGKLQNEATSRIRNPRQRQMFQMEAQTMASLGAVEIQGLARGKEVDQGRATTIQNLDALAQTALTDPRGAAAAIQTANTIIEAAVDRGYFKPEEGVLRRQAWAESYGKGSLAVLAARDGPQAAVDVLRRRLGITGATVGAAAADIKTAILQQESGNRDNIGASVDGAVGPGQITPATFARYAKPGEVITNPADNRAVSARIIDDYTKRFGDPARVAVAYFSGEANVAPAGSATPWKRDTRDGNGKSVSSYVGDVVGRLRGSGSATVQTGTGVGRSGTPADYIRLDDAAVLLRQFENQADAELGTVRRDLAQQHQDDVAFVQGGGDPNKIQATPDRMRGLFDERVVAEAQADIARAKQFADANREIATAPQTRVNQILAGAKPTGAGDYRDQARDARALWQAADARNQAIKNDAAAYVGQHDPQVNAALQSALAGKPGAWDRVITTTDAAYDRMQIPGQFRNVLPKGVATEIAGKIASGDGSAISAQIDNLRSSMSARTWDRFYGDLVRVGKLDTIGQLAAEIDPRNSRAKAAFGAVARVSQEELNKLIPESSDRKDIREAAASALEDFRATIVTGHTGAAGQQMYLAREDAVTRLAMQYVATGQIPNVSQAAEVAANDLVNWAYDYTDDWRAPKSGNGVSRIDDVQSYLDTFEARFTPQDIGFTEADRRLGRTVIGEPIIRGHLFNAEKVWRNTRDDAGLQWFYAGTGEPVLGKNGKPVIVLFDKIPLGSASPPFEIRTGGMR